MRMIHKTKRAAKQIKMKNSVQVGIISKVPILTKNPLIDVKISSKSKPLSSDADVVAPADDAGAGACVPDIIYSS